MMNRSSRPGTTGGHAPTRGKVPRNALLATVCLLAFVFSAGRASASPGDSNAQAVQKAVNYLAPSVSNWTIDKGCIACHHQGSALYGLAMAKGTGFTIDMSANLGAPFIAQAIVNDQDSGGSWLWGGPQRLKSSYNLYGLAGYDAFISTAYSNNLVSGADWALTSQSPDGRWVMDFEDGDTAHGDMTTTARFMVGMAQAMQRVDPAKAATYQAAMTKAVNYITAHKADSSDVSGTGIVYELSWAIIGLKAAGVSDSDATLQGLVTDLLTRKSSLGYAWGYYSGNSPDIFNSGMAVYALCTSGVPQSGNTQLLQSLDWVNNQQSPDGTWGSDIFTTFATLGLSCYGDYGVKLHNTGPVSKIINPASASPQTVTYTFDLQNHGVVNDTYNLTVVGGMPGWTTSIVSPIGVLAGVHQTVTLTVNAPANLPAALPVQMAVVATSQAVPTLTASARITTFTDPPPPTSGDSTKVTLTGGNGSSVANGQTIVLSATVKDSTVNSPTAGPGKGVVTFFVAGLAIGTDTDADGDGVFSFSFVPDCGWTATGAQDFRAIYSGIDLPGSQTDLLSSFAAGTLTITVPACCAKPEVCDGVDNDCDGVIDNGFHVGAACSNGIGQCSTVSAIVCRLDGTSTCPAVPGAPSAEVCGDQVDSDCDGNLDNGCACLTDAACGGSTSGMMCDTGIGASYTCVLGCHGTGGNGCGAGLHCTSQDSGAGACVACLGDNDCGGSKSGVVCDTAKHTCVAGCRGSDGNTCSMSLVCTSNDSSIGACVGCLADASCGTAESGTVCDAATHACTIGCRGTDGNGCSASLVCTSKDASVGFCAGCVADSDCGDAASGAVCDGVKHACVSGCRGAGGNRCSGKLVCTSQDGAAGQCVGCMSDTDCGDAKSGAVCDASSKKCMVGCRGGVGNGNGCSGNLVCTSSDAKVGSCAVCLSDADCGGAASGKICNASTLTCAVGCRSAGGNGCSGNLLCTSTDGAAGTCAGCLADADCGGPNSGIACESGSKTCVAGCRASEGNACAAGKVCTSNTAALGACVECVADSDCGGAGSGKVCDKQACHDGCRGGVGNGCPGELTCSSMTEEVGTCGPRSTGTSSSSSAASSSSSGAGGSDASAAASSGSAGGSVPYQGKTTGLMCSTQPGIDGHSGNTGWLLGGALAALVSWRRRRAA